MQQQTLNLVCDISYTIGYINGLLAKRDNDIKTVKALIGIKNQLEGATKNFLIENKEISNGVI